MAKTIIIIFLIILMTLFLIKFQDRAAEPVAVPVPDTTNYLRDVYNLDVFCVDCLDRIISDMADRYYLDRRLLIALIKVESVNFNIWAISHNKRCFGLMQVDTATAKDICVRYKIKYKSIINLLFNPYYNILIGCIHLAELRERTENNQVLYLTLYNVGEGNYRNNPQKYVYPDYKFVEKINTELKLMKGK